MPARPKVAIVVFPGSNCEHDVAAALEGLGARAELVWHRAISLTGYDGVVLPGGFAHGDYLRPGALARFSPVMSEIEYLAGTGAPVLGICNGFQILTEANLLPGALRCNSSSRFMCQNVECTVTSASSMLTSMVQTGQILRLPINHFEGSYACEPALLDQLEQRGQVVLSYVENPNGSMRSVAGVCNEAGNVVGIMPHPERASDPLIGGTDGLLLLEAFLAAAGDPHAMSSQGTGSQGTGSHKVGQAVPSGPASQFAGY
ncbi:MAG: phosphoribosylformylglycinamidine synthase subunit PurQ [Acidimicrobiales bacterium]